MLWIGTKKGFITNTLEIDIFKKFKQKKIKNKNQLKANCKVGGQLEMNGEV